MARYELAYDVNAITGKKNLPHMYLSDRIIIKTQIVMPSKSHENSDKAFTTKYKVQWA